MVTFSKTFGFNFRRDHQKIFLWASRLWVGRRKEPILGYVSKNDVKKNSGGKGLNMVVILVNRSNNQSILNYTIYILVFLLFSFLQLHLLCINFYLIITYNHITYISSRLDVSAKHFKSRANNLVLLSDINIYFILHHE